MSYSVTLTGNGNTIARQCRNNLAITIRGTYGSGTAKVQVSDSSDGTFVDVVNGNFDSGSNVKIVNWNGWVRVNLSGATSPSLYVSMTKPSEL